MRAGDGAMVVILTALGLEHESVRRWLSPVRRVDHPAGTIFEVGRPPSRPGLVALAVSGQGNLAAAVLTERAIATLRPRAVFLVGVAGALREDIELGDVVVATRVHAYHGGAEYPDGFRPRSRGWDTSHQLDQIARHVAFAGNWAAIGPDRPAPSVHFRPIVSGEVALKARTSPLFRHLRHVYEDAAAIDMESAGTFLAAHLNGSVPVLTIRGISDRADDQYGIDSYGWRPVAAANAAAFAIATAAEVCEAATLSGASTALSDMRWMSDHGYLDLLTARQRLLDGAD